MTDTLPSLPGLAVQIDQNANVHCPACGEVAVKLAGTSEVQPSGWVNHTIECLSCKVQSRLALVSFGDRLVVRWLDSD